MSILLEYALAHDENIVPISQFFTDAASGNLPGFCIVDPTFNGGSEENPDDIRIGEQFCFQGHQRGDVGPWLEEDAARVAVRRARRLLRPRPAAERGGAGRHPPRPGCGGPAGGLRSLRLPRPRGDRVAVRQAADTSRPSSATTRPSSSSSSASGTLASLTRRDAAADDLLDCLDFENPPAFLEPPKLPAPALAATSPLVCTPGDPGALPQRRPRRSSVAGPLADTWGRRRRSL